MSDLHFKVILVPKILYNPAQKDALLSDVKECVADCELDVVSVSFLKAAKSEEEVHPEIEELIVEIHARADVSYAKYGRLDVGADKHKPRKKHIQYYYFCCKWKEMSVVLPCTTYIVFYTDESFLPSRKAQTRLSLGNFSFGVLPYDGTFHQYTSKVQHQGATFYHDSRNVVVKVDDYEMIFSYDNIRNIIVNTQSSALSEIFLDLFNPPIINRVEVKTNKSGEQHTVKHRNLNFATESSCQFEIDKETLGRSNVLCLIFFNADRELETISANIHFSCSKKSILYSSVSTLLACRPADPIIPDMPFGCLYLTTAMFKRNFVLMAQAGNREQGYFSYLTNLSGESSKSLEKALTDVLLALDSGKILNYWYAIENRYRYYFCKKDAVDFKEYVIPSRCCMIRRITLTPTRQLLWPPEILFGNRVLRNFDSDFAVRVSLRDDNMQRLSHSTLFADIPFVESSIKLPISNGIRIGPRHYKFLAWSNSQIRDHGVWMYAADTFGRTSVSIRRWMGNFSHIHNVPKYMARMGQCFSQTEDTVFVPLNPQSVRTVPDIMGGHDITTGKPYCFSDGIGRISTVLAKQVHDALGHDKLCSAFQIRYGGYKGMLVVDPTLKDVLIEFRNSMKKFDCPNSTRLEIASTSAPITLQLNRPFITILNDLGVRHRVLLRLQEIMLKEITDMLFDEEKAAQSLGTKTALYNFKALTRSGIFLTTEPFFRSMLLALHRHKIAYLKSKANVSVDPDFGRNMLGALDETGILDYGQVFVQYTNDIARGETTKDTTILKGEVLVTKNPCHFPGDVRKFWAVDVPQLRHIVDCIVFPQGGPRPHPSEMSGSDLDGDEYAVLWLPDLIFYNLNKEPAHFPSSKSADVRNITETDMIHCLQEYIKKDQIGSMSHAHLALADKLGVEHPICLSVAKKISIAVDFAKTGKVQPLEKNEKPTEFPDFMEKNFRPQYKSQKALGKMYRICRDYETENEETTFMHQTIKVDPDLMYPGWEEYEEEAKTMRNKYNSILGSLLRNYGFENESQVISGAFSKLHCRFQERKDLMEVQTIILLCVKKLKKSMMEEFLEEFNKTEDMSAIQDAIFRKASAWYMVTYSDPEAKFLSFPWIVSSYLANIKIVKTLGRNPQFSPAIVKFDEKIIECENANLLPDYHEIDAWCSYDVLCEPQLLKRALYVLILWAQDEEIVGKPNFHEGFLYMDTFIKLFLHVAELRKYVAKKGVNTKGKGPYSPGKLCVEFLKFCSSLRFYNKNDVNQVLPFSVYKYSKLAKRAVLSYHRFALTGIFRNLYFDAKIKEDLLDMKPFPIDSKIFSESPISDVCLRKAEQALLKYSGVNEVHLNEYRQTKKVWVSAIGSELALKELKAILRKKHVALRQLFRTGAMVETVGFSNSSGVKRTYAEFSGEND